MTWEWVLIRKNCTGCAICVDVCPEEAVELPREKAYPEPRAGKCTGCLICVKECPFAAIEVRKVHS